MRPQRGFDSRGGTIAKLKQDHFGGMAVDHDALHKIFVLRDDRETVIVRELPYFLIAGLQQVEIAHMSRLGVKVRDSRNDPEGEILIK